MRVTHITDYITPMSSQTKSKTTTRDTNGIYRKNYTDTNGVKIRESFIPTTRPPYTEWVKSLGITEITHLYHPDAKSTADRINESAGVPLKPTLIDELLGRDVWDSERYE